MSYKNTTKTIAITLTDKGCAILFLVSPVTSYFNNGSEPQFTHDHLHMDPLKVETYQLIGDVLIG